MAVLVPLHSLRGYFRDTCDQACSVPGAPAAATEATATVRTLSALRAGCLLGNNDVLRLKALGALLGREFYLVAFVQRSKAIPFQLDGRIVHENIIACFAFRGQFLARDNETKTLLGVKPFDNTFLRHTLPTLFTTCVC